MRYPNFRKVPTSRDTRSVFRTQKNLQRTEKNKEKRRRQRKDCLVEARESLLRGREEHRKEHCPQRRRAGCGAGRRV